MNRLSVFSVRHASRPGRYGDGGGLYLVVQPIGAKSWICRVQREGRRREISLYDIWRAIWGHAIGPDWIPASRDAMIYNELSITPEGCWNDACFCVFHSRGQANQSTGVGFTDKWIEIVFSVDDDTGPLLRALETFEWRDEDQVDWPGWLTFKLKKSPWDESVSWTALRTVAKQAVAAANKIAVRP